MILFLIIYIIFIYLIILISFIIPHRYPSSQVLALINQTIKAFVNVRQWRVVIEGSMCVRGGDYRGANVRQGRVVIEGLICVRGDDFRESMCVKEGCFVWFSMQVKWIYFRWSEMG